MHDKSKTDDVKKVLQKLNVPRSLETETYNMLKGMINHKCYANPRFVPVDVIIISGLHNTFLGISGP